MFTSTLLLLLQHPLWALAKSSHSHKDDSIHQYQDDWMYTLSQMDRNSTEFYESYRCGITDSTRIVDDADDAFSPWVTAFLKCKNLETKELSVAVCHEYCRDRFRNCATIKHVINKPVFRMENLHDRWGQVHNVQVPVACHCQVKTHHVLSTCSKCRDTKRKVLQGFN